MQNQSALAPSESNITDLFALSDEQILEIVPEPAGASKEDSGALNADIGVSVVAPTTIGSHESPVIGHQSTDQGTGTQPRIAVPLEPPAWLAAQMSDAWAGEEAREFWDGVQQARSEGAAYRAAIASPEDARALKELYPGGVSEARAAAERARLLDDVDRAYFGASGNSPEQTSASRAQLAQRMLREDPAAFREMVETGIRVLQEITEAQSRTGKTLASAVADARKDTSAGATGTSSVVAQHAAPLQANQRNAATAGTAHNDAHVAAYAAFERAANEDLERSVGGVIERTLAQALPSFEQHNTPGQARLGEQAGAHRAAPLRDRLAASVRVDVEKALQGDRQLGWQVAQILSSRRFDNDARAQIVRLIGKRAQQLVPGAARRVLNEWTQTTLAAHRGRTQPAEAAPARAEVAPASVPERPSGNQKTQTRRQDVSATKSHAINYRKFSDEQILEM
jgi:hypothetical protein